MMTDNPEASYRHEVNPALAINLLQDLQVTTLRAQQELRKLVSQIQHLYAAGPLVDGWLESLQEQEPSTVDTALLRHADIDALMDYVESLDPPGSSDHQERPGDAQYRLCMLDKSGQVQSRPCPPEQVPVVSMAIARHQKLRQLLERKQQLELKLHRIVDGLAALRRQISLE
jgi:hypothetical protein